MIKFSDRMNLMKGSAIRELLKLAEQGDIISFAGGFPAPELFPVKEIMAASKAVMEEMGTSALQYSSTEGYRPLREKIAKRMGEKNGIKTDADHILMTSGSQEGLAFSAQVFINKGDVILLEAPSYLGAINAFKACEPNFVSIPTDNEGMLMDELEKTLANTQNIKMIYVIPDFQNPSGKTWSLERRKKFMELVNKYEIPVIEDNPYGELRFKGEYLPSLKSMDTKGLVVYLGTFSKILAPGYRLGWVCAESEILQKYNYMKQGASLQTSTIGMMEVNKFMDMNDIDEHIEKIRDVYGKRCKLMIDTMRAEFPEGVEFTDPDGGLFTWVTVPKHIDTKVMAEECLKRKVAYVPGETFFPDPGHVNHFRCNYSNMPEDKIVEGIKILGEVIKANM